MSKCLGFYGVIPWVCQKPDLFYNYLTNYLELESVSLRKKTCEVRATLLLTLLNNVNSLCTNSQCLAVTHYTPSLMMLPNLSPLYITLAKSGLLHFLYVQCM